MFPHVLIEKTTQTCVIPMTLPMKAVMSISCVSDAVFLKLRQNLMQMHCSFKSTIRKLWVACNMLRNTHPTQKQCKRLWLQVTTLTQKTVISWNLVAEGSTTYHSWSSKQVQKLLGTHSYA
jgi:hypothetical protein